MILPSSKTPIAILLSIATLSALYPLIPSYVEGSTQDIVIDSNPIVNDPSADSVPAPDVKEQIVADVVSIEEEKSGYTLRKSLNPTGSRKPIPNITGDTVRERAISFLDTAGLGHTITAWEEGAIEYKIYYTLPLCIAFADSHLGKALKSTNNIGNVGNNDRGNVVHYATLGDGIKAIFHTLRSDGGWMRNTEQLGYLSGEGRTRLGLPGCKATSTYQKCYASSEEVWSTNVRNCMSTIHNRQVDENFYFRLNL